MQTVRTQDCPVRSITPHRLGAVLLLIGLVLAMPFAAHAVLPNSATLGQQPGAEAKSPAQAPPGVPFQADKLSTLLPATVYFQGRTAPLQTRNAGGTTFGRGAIVWVSLVDASGYATGVQERYQFYLVTEGPLHIGDAQLAAGAYGGGFVGDRFVIMDLGGHTVAEGPTQLDTALPRPRPLQVVADTPNAVKLYLGRHWVTLRADPAMGR